MEKQKRVMKGERVNVIAVISPPKKIKGEITPPGDKSISHRAAILSALARGTSSLENFLTAEDCMRTVNCLRSLGVKINVEGDNLEVEGRNLGFKSSSTILNAGNSGTTARLLLGVLSGQPFWSRIRGDASLSRRPMLRVVDPLREMGAAITGKEEGNKLPLRVKGGKLTSIDYQMKVASAQVKSAILLASLFAEGKTRIHEAELTRDHTEIMMEHMGFPLKREARYIELEGPVPSYEAVEIRIPGDFSSAVFFAVAASVVPGSELLIKDVGVNHTRIGALEVLRQMGASVEMLDFRHYGSEPVTDLLVKGDSKLKGVTVEGEMIPRMIDEIPAVCVAALAAEGRTVIKGAEELRVKETDRIAALVQELGRLGAGVQEREDGIEIEGGIPLKGNKCSSHGDHRMAMALAVAGMMAEGDTGIENFEAVQISYPGFMQDLRYLIEK